MFTLCAKLVSSLGIEEEGEGRQCVVCEINLPSITLAHSLPVLLGPSSARGLQATLPTANSAQTGDEGH